MYLCSTIGRLASNYFNSSHKPQSDKISPQTETTPKLRSGSLIGYSKGVYQRAVTTAKTAVTTTTKWISDHPTLSVSAAAGSAILLGLTPLAPLGYIPLCGSGAYLLKGFFNNKNKSAGETNTTTQNNHKNPTSAETEQTDSGLQKKITLPEEPLSSANHGKATAIIKPSLNSAKTPSTEAATVTKKVETETTGKSPVKNERAKRYFPQVKLNKATRLRQAAIKENFSSSERSTTSQSGETDGEFQWRYNHRLLRSDKKLDSTTRK